MEDSLPGSFAPLDVSIPGRFATSLDISPPDDKEVLTVSQIPDFETGDETSQGSETSWYRNVQKCETSKWRIIHVANRPGSEASR